MRRNILLSVFAGFIILGGKVAAQSPSVISPSPSSAALAKFSEVPVDLSTGVPQITIPLYTLGSSTLRYPLSISYNASGIRVNEVASSVGTGWVLNAGGMVSRTMRGRPDEQSNGYFSFAASVPNQADNIVLDLKQGLASREFDMTPDLFYYSTGMGGGKVVFDNLLNPRSIPHSPVVISTNSTSTLSTFTVTNPDGIMFEYAAGESATATIPEIGTSMTFTSSWYLSRMVSADKLDTIRFNYALRPSYTYTSNENLGLRFFYNVPSGAARALNEINSIQSKTIITVTGTRYLTSIEHKGGKADFVFGSRTDDPNENKLDRIVIYGKDPVTGALVEERRINFAYSYFQNTDTGTRLRLDSFREQLNSTTFNPPYIFSYSHKLLPAPGSTAQDHWGYYNGAVLNTSLIPAYTHPPTGYVLSTNDRSINTAYVDGCMLKAITSPLGGRTEYIFEPNQYYNGTVNADGPGVRIAKIITSDPVANINAITNYEYLVPGASTSSGKLMNSPNYFTTLPVVDNNHGNNYAYECLLIQTNATSVGNFTGAPLIYEYVTTYQANDVNVTGKSISKFSVYPAPILAYPYFAINEDSWSAGDLLTQEHYKLVGGVATLVKRIQNTYAESPYYSTAKGLSVASSKIFFFAEPELTSDFIISNYFAPSKFKYLSQVDTYDYEQNSGTLNLARSQKFFYDRTNVHLFPTKVETTNSGGETVRAEYTYAADFTGGVYTVMKNKNMTGLPVESFSSIVRAGNAYINGYQKTEYFEWSTGKVYPKNFYDAKLPLNTLKSSFEASPATYTRLNSRINKYNASGIGVETEVIGDKANAIITDQYFNQVIASATIASADQVAFTSFESKDFGNWNVVTGTATGSATATFTLSNTFESFLTSSAQTINYNYSVTRSNGPSPLLVFTKEGSAPISQALIAASGSGSLSLPAGQWNVSLEYDFNVTAITASFPYQYSYTPAAPIVATQFKTGTKSLLFGTGNSITKTLLPAGNYTVVYYQKGGTITLTPTGGATVTSTMTGTTEADGWTKVQKEVTIGSTAQGIQLTGTGFYIDELRLYPSGALMATSCYDTFKQRITGTDANLKSQFIEYDERRRVKVIRDHDKNIVQYSDYKVTTP